MDILIQIHNTNPHFPLSLLIIFVENCLLLQNYSSKIMEILIKNHNIIPHFPFFVSKLMVEIFLFLQNYFLKDNNLAKNVQIIVDVNIFIGMFLHGNTNGKS